MAKGESDPSFQMLGRAIRVLRAERGLSRADLAEAVGISYSYLTEIETKKQTQPSTKVIGKLASYFGIRPHELMARAESLARGDESWEQESLRREDALEPHDPARGSHFHSSELASCSRAPIPQERMSREDAQNLRAPSPDDHEIQMLRKRLTGAIQSLHEDDLRRLLDLATRLSGSKY